MRNILTVIAAPHWGGLHVLVERSTRFYAGARFRRFVVMPCSDEKMKQRLEVAGCSVIPLELVRPRRTRNIPAHIRYIVGFLPDVWKLAAIIRAHNIEAVEVAGLLNFQAVIAAKLTGARLVWQFHSTLAPKTLRRVVGWIAVRTADVIMTSGAAMIAKHGGLGGGGRPIISFCAPIDVDVFKPDPATRSRVRDYFEIAPGRVVVGTIGNKGWQKAHENIISIADTLRHAYFNFIISGSAVESNADYYRREVVDRVESLSLDASVKVVEQPFTSNEILNAFDIFILPSRAEGLSIVTAEAMAMGLPVVVSNVGSVSDLVEHGENGFLCDPNSLEEFCDALLFLSSETERVRMGKRSRLKIVREANAEKCAQAHFSAYEQALM